MKRCAPLASLAFASSAFAQSPVTPPDFHMPGGPGCAGEIARYQAVMDNDFASGNVAKSVYLQVKREIAAARKACVAGQEARATEMVHASEARHGYSTHL
jgi:hypothetical protein